jgi:hypothetical protein
MFKDSTAEAGSIAYNHGDNYIKLSTNGTNGGTERLRIDSDGAVNIGSNPAQATGTNTQNAILTVKGYPSSETSAAILALVRGNNSASTSANHTMGRIVFADKQAGEYAFIEGEAEANGSVGDTPGRLSFSTSPDGTSAPTEKLRISSAGYVTKPAHPTFCARWTSGDAQDINSGDIIKFTNVSSATTRWNNGGHYSTSTGKFTAPVAGFYYFAGRVMTTGWNNGDDIQDLISIQSSAGLITYPTQRRSRFRSDADANGYYTSSISAQVQAGAGATFWLQSNRNGNGSGWDAASSSYSFFTGWLIG